MALSHIQWGQATLHLDNETFQKAFTKGDEACISMIVNTASRKSRTT